MRATVSNEFGGRRALSDFPAARCVAVPDYFTDSELAVVLDALHLAGLKENASLLRHSAAIAAAFVHSQGRESYLSSFLFLRWL